VLDCVCILVADPPVSSLQAPKSTESNQHKQSGNTVHAFGDETCTARQRNSDGTMAGNLMCRKVLTKLSV
jgi:hypothetical protein